MGSVCVLDNEGQGGVFTKKSPAAIVQEGDDLWVARCCGITPKLNADSVVSTMVAGLMDAL